MVKPFTPWRSPALGRKTLTVTFGNPAPSGLLIVSMTRHHGKGNEKVIGLDNERLQKLKHYFEPSLCQIRLKVNLTQTWCRYYID